MPHVTDTPPEAVTRDPDGLRNALDQRLPARTLDRNLLIGTWNIRHVGGPTEQWRAGDDDDSPKRDLHSIRVVAEIIRRFDVVTIQEVRGDLKALRPDWGFVLTDVTRGDERYDAFVSTGLEVPADLHAVPRTIFADPGDPGSHFYDQIAWFTGDAGQPALSLDYVRGGSFDFGDVTLPRRDLTRASLSWRVSDHYPLWAEFSRR